MKQKNMPIGAPGSVFKIARSLASFQQASLPAAVPQNESWVERAARIASEMEGTDLFDLGNTITKGEVIDL